MKKTSINVTDMVFATIEVGGRVLASFCKSNFDSVAQVVKDIRSIAGQFIGLASLTIRNKTQGWNIQLSIANARVPQSIHAA